MVEEREARILPEEVAGVKSVGVREEDEAVSVVVELLDNFPHGIV